MANNGKPRWVDSPNWTNSVTGLLGGPRDEKTVAAQRWARQQQVSENVGRLRKWVRKHPYATVAIALVWVGIVTGITWLYAFAVVAGAVGVWRRQVAQQKQSAHLAREIEAIGGEANYELAKRMYRSWPQTALAASLVQKRSDVDGVGVRAALRGYLDQHAQLRRAAHGNWDDYDIPGVRQVVQKTLGVALEVVLLRGQRPATYVAVADVLAAAWKVTEVRVEDVEPGVVALIAVTRDPLAEGVEIASGQVPQGDTSAVRIGRLEDGSDLRFRLDQTSSVVGGVPGSGKSVILNVVLAGVAFNPNVQVVGIDCKRMVEFYDWMPRMAATAGDQESALTVLQRLDELGTARLDALRGSGFKSVSRQGYSPDNPLIVVVIDECAELFDASLDRKLAGELVGLVSRGVRLFRAAGIVYVLATQKPTVDVLPSQIRDNCANRIAGQCTTNDQAAAVLGPAPDDLSVATPVNMPRRPGMVVAADDAGRRAYGRSDFISESVAAEIASASAYLRRDLWPVDGLVAS